MKKWNEIRSFSKVTLDGDTTLPSFNGELRAIPKGTYFITGFWLDMCGLNRNDPNGENELTIQSRSLSAFNEVE